MAERLTQVGVFLLHILIFVALCNGRPLPQDNQPGTITLFNFFFTPRSNLQSGAPFFLAEVGGRK